MRRERFLRPWFVAAIVLAVAGLIVNVWRPTAPPTTAVTTPLDDFGREVLALVRAYRVPRRSATLTVLGLSILVPLVAVGSARGRRILGRLAGDGGRPVVRGAVVAVALVAAIDLVAFPIDYLIGFVHEGRFGFRTSDLVGWLRDWAITNGIGWALAGLGGAAFVVALRRWPAGWPWRAVVLGTGAAALLVLSGPLVIEPLLLETRPLADGPVRRAVAGVLTRAGEGDVPILVGDASRRTTKVNAYVSGLGPSRRVVLYDTILDLPPERVALVVAHELAHREHRDIPRSVLGTAAAIVPLALITRAVLRSRWTARRFDGARRDDPRLVAVGLTVLTMSTIVGLPVASYLSRRAEAAADHRALELTEAPEAMVAVARGFVVRDLADPRPPDWFHVLVGTHPAPAERVRAAVAHAHRSGDTIPDPSALLDREGDLLHPRLRGD